MGLLVVGLGNPGPDFFRTRHNVGSDLVDRLVLKHRLSLSRAEGYGYSVFNCEGRRVVFVKPLTYMNLSGSVFPSVLSRFSAKISDLLVIVDNVDLPLGRCKLRRVGGVSTHNGLRSISERLGSTRYSRLYIGVGNNSEGGSLRDFVLSKFSDNEIKCVENVFSFLGEEILSIDEFNFEDKVRRINSSSF
ncbi:aminoacyl-tRNA hydrolase [Borrelia sp. BU AG58]|uniref:aminoacyl-tRNA hydrolase n=1 Tax=Borrelia sp. BU AG58 TaxID=2887345 RepID=UPI001E5C0E16|nr:aminoacyl-tRNA hydrolase [Borrelia sp. BU AG58]UER67928.1 aminoacyl-tRNA hydrolase [Borrelia sp. BU AG58]